MESAVQHLLELAGDRDREHGLAQVYRLAEQREAAAGHDRARRTQVVDESVLAERPVHEAAFGDVALEVAPDAVGAARIPLRPSAWTSSSAPLWV